MVSYDFDGWPVIIHNKVTSFHFEHSPIFTARVWLDQRVRKITMSRTSCIHVQRVGCFPIACPAMLMLFISKINNLCNICTVHIHTCVHIYNYIYIIVELVWLSCLTPCLLPKSSIPHLRLPSIVRSITSLFIANRYVCIYIYISMYSWYPTICIYTYI